MYRRSKRNGLYLRFVLIAAMLSAICACDPNNQLARLTEGALYCENAGTAIERCCNLPEFYAGYEDVCQAFANAQATVELCEAYDGAFTGYGDPLSAADVSDLDCAELLSKLRDLGSYPDGDVDSDTDGDEETAPCTIDGAACDDNDPCTVGDKCANGECVPGDQMDCSEFDRECTIGVCRDGECSESPASDGTVCDDENPCTIFDACEAGNCLGSVKTCDDENPCTADSCDLADGSCINDQAANEGLACTSEDPCYPDGNCESGQCSSQSPGDCTRLDDQCNTGVCEAEGCVAVARLDGEECDDGVACTVSDQCDGGVCRGTDRDCDDENPCTADSCEASSGECIHDKTVMEMQACDDGDGCTVNDICMDGVCQPGSAKDCSSFDSMCLVGVCAEGVCRSDPRPDDTECNDSNICTEDDRCVAGNCEGTEKDCEDFDTCTDDWCDQLTGECRHQPSESVCIINQACYPNLYSSPMEPICAICDVNNSRTSWTGINNGLDCSTSPCHIDDHCADGQCVFTEKDCPSDDPCLVGSCNLATGDCEYTNICRSGIFCDDGDPKTVNDTLNPDDRCSGTPLPIGNGPDGGPLVVRRMIADDESYDTLCLSVALSSEEEGDVPITLYAPDGKSWTMNNDKAIDDSEAGVLRFENVNLEEASSNGVWTIVLQSSHRISLSKFEISFDACMVARPQNTEEIEIEKQFEAPLLPDRPQLLKIPELSE